MSELSTLQGFLTEAGLKFIPVDERTLGLLFKGEAREQILIQLRVADGLVIALSPVPDKPEDETILHNLLRVTMDADMMKVFSGQSDILFASEVPFEHVHKGSLEGVVRQLVQAVDATAQTMRNFEQFQQTVLVGTYLCRQASGPLYSGSAAAAIPGYCQALGIEYTKLDESKFRVNSPGTILKLNIVVVCRDTLVTFLAFTDLKCTGSRREFYQRLFDLNRRVNVARVAMDKDDELCFIYEVPGLNQKTFQQAVQTLEQAVGLFVMGGAGGATAQSSPVVPPTPAAPPRGGFWDRLRGKKS
jgi:hypothetical protein